VVLCARLRLAAREELTSLQTTGPGLQRDTETAAVERRDEAKAAKAAASEGPASASGPQARMISVSAPSAKAPPRLPRSQTQANKRTRDETLTTDERRPPFDTNLIRQIVPLFCALRRAAHLDALLACM
jgi:hypothetical protein